MEDRIFIENGDVRKCGNCGEVYAFENHEKILYRNILLVFHNKISGKKVIKCRKCKTLIDC